MKKNKADLQIFKEYSRENDNELVGFHTISTDIWFE